MRVKPANPGDAEWFTAREAALRLAVNERTILRAIARGELPAAKQRGVFLIDAAALAAFGRVRSGSRASAAGAGFGMPAPPSPFAGRGDELAAAMALLAEGARLVTLTGPGGVGKTRLALAVAAAVSSAVVADAVFVPLESIRDPDHVVGAIARALGVQERGDLPLSESLLEAVARRRQLVVLENFEQVLPEAGMVADLLAAGPGLRVLETSREVLRLLGEHELVMPPLAPGWSSPRDRVDSNC